MSNRKDPVMDLERVRPSQFAAPIDLLTVVTKFPLAEEIVRDDEPLAGKVYAALRHLLGPKHLSVRRALEFRWLLLLAINKMRVLGEPATRDRDTWVASLRELAEEDGGLRQQGGTLIADFFESAPWGLQKQPGAPSFDTVRTANAIHAGVVQFSHQLAAELKKAEEEDGVVLQNYDVEEAGVEDDDDDDDDDETISATKSTARPRGRNMKRTGAQSSTQGAIAGHGNHAHGRATAWTTAEHIGLLELYRDNTDRKLVSHPQIALLHNARFWPRFGEGRTPAAVSQQYLKLVRHDTALIPAKIRELRLLLLVNGTTGTTTAAAA